MRLEDGIRDGRWPPEYAPSKYYYDARHWSLKKLHAEITNLQANLARDKEHHAQCMRTVIEPPNFPYPLLRRIMSISNTIAYLVELRLTK